MQTSKEFSSIVPIDSNIAQYIAYYYFQESKSEDYCHNYIYYPNYVTGLSIYKNSSITWSDEGRIIEASNEEQLTSLYTILKGKSKVVTMKGRVSEIGIIFKPLGVNHFIDCSLDNLVKGVVTPFDYFGAPLLTVCEKVFDEPDLNKKADLLDRFFIENLVGFEHAGLKEIVQHILSEEINYSIEEMAKLLGVNRKMIYRTFKKHLCFSPREFKSLVKFRKALKTYKNNGQSANLTQIAYESGYYDQAEFIRRNKALVGLTPKELYASLKKVGKLDTYWTLPDL